MCLTNAEKSIAKTIIPKQEIKENKLLFQTDIEVRKQFMLRTEMLVTAL